MAEQQERAAVPSAGQVTAGVLAFAAFAVGAGVFAGTDGLVRWLAVLVVLAAVAAGVLAGTAHSRSRRRS